MEPRFLGEGGEIKLNYRSSETMKKLMLQGAAAAILGAAALAVSATSAAAYIACNGEGECSLACP